MQELFSNSELIVYTNGSGEIFIQPRANKGATIRVGPGNRHGTLNITCAQGRLVPWAINGLSAIVAEG